LGNGARKQGHVSLQVVAGIVRSYAVRPHNHGLFRHHTFYLACFSFYFKENTGKNGQSLPKKG
jgi:hypothetical protein